jgi:excinuclease UvrABC nuclease subunit
MPIGGEKYAFTKENVGNAPDEHGVYALYDNSTLIYIGRAAGKDVTISSRLQSHKSGDEGACTKNASHYKRETTSSPIGREKELVQEYKDSNSDELPRCNDVDPT